MRSGAERLGFRLSTASTTVSVSGLGSRVADGKGEIEPPELALPEDPAQRLMLDHAAQHRPQTASLRGIYGPIGAAEKLCPRDRESRGYQSASLTAGLLEAGRGEHAGRLGNQRIEGLRHRPQASTAASLAAWSSARIASMISSSASPLMTLSILYSVRLMRWSVTLPWGKL